MLCFKKYGKLRTRKNPLEINNSFFILTKGLIFNKFSTMVFAKKINVEANSVDLTATKLKDILKLCNPSEQFVLTEKYGLISWKPTPMQQIGKKFDMSRERIRQILNKSLNKVRRLISHDEYLLAIVNKANKIVVENGFLISEKNLIEELMKDKNIDLNYNELLLILSSDYDLYYLHRNKRFEKVFFVEPMFEDLLNDIHDTAFLKLKESKNAIETKDLISYLQSVFLQKFQRNQSLRDVLSTDKLYENIFNLSRHIFSFDNKVGLEDNAEVNPKTIKLKIKHVLQKEWKAMHYEEIANKIKEKFNLNKIKTSTVHNELVKNADFVNVWMWTYWLKEWWYQGETTIDAIKNILKKAWRPMKINEITKEVLKERMIREITILMVLQKNPDVFKRVEKWLYTLK